MSAMSFILEDLAKIGDAVVKGDPACKIEAVNTLKSAQEGDIAFLSNRRYANFLLATNASAVILKENDLAACPTNALVTDDPYLTYAKIANHLYPKMRRQPDRVNNVTVGEDSRIDKTACLLANVTIGNNVVIGANTVISSGCVIEDNVTIGSNTTLMANVTICHDVMIGDAVILSPGVVIGADGFGIVRDEHGHWQGIPQIGSVLIMDEVEIGANSTVDRGAIENTIINKRVKIDNQVQIAHNVIIGEDTVIAGCAAIAGSTIIGKNCQIGGAVAINGHIEITDNVIITGMSGVPNSISTAGIYSSGLMITTNNIWKRNIVRFNQLDHILKKIMKRLDLS